MDHGNDDELTKVHPDHVRVLRIQSFAAGAFCVIAAVIAGLIFPPVRWYVIALGAALALFWIIRLPARRYAHKGYMMSGDRLRVARGMLFRRDTVVPFGRVQHIDVTQNPLERFYGLATLVVHTAGTHNSSVALAGLKRADADAMREDIRRHIKRETL
ncbi:PH domain-containing protein [Altererythrobacter indicus]|uniref:PH domain-containing protein n=1 Tax=Altericroceibacterium indicum TaxID=374177 RepID=A0A845A8G6_9SPHN|nr:PH domain-containing protein [Altericroceibacterium indicum]MXP25827.1 PH domain-containing protein [Altericroceibacterium indicum]